MSEVQYREETDRQADKQRDGKTTDQIRTDHIQNQGGDERGQIAVDNRGKGFIKTILNRQSQAGSSGKFFSHSLVNEHVRVDRHTNRQHQTRQSGKCEGCRDQGHRSNDHQ